VLRLAYAHAIMHANRPLLLSNLADLARRPNSKHQMLKSNIQLCVEEAKTVVDLVNSFVEDDMMFQAFWFTQYISFCAVAVLYIYTIQQYHSRSLSSSTGQADLMASNVDDNFLDLAERCQHHLAEATRKSSPSKRYNIILEELRLEVHRQAQRGTRQLPVEMWHTAVGNTSLNEQSHVMASTYEDQGPNPPFESKNSL
jgi:hypothetical protein